VIVGVGDDDAVGCLVSVILGVMLLVNVGIGDWVSVLVGWGVFDGVSVCVLVWVGVVLGVRVREGVREAVGEGDSVGVMLGVWLSVGDIVGVGGSGVSDGVNEGKSVATIGVVDVLVIVGRRVIVGVGVGSAFRVTVMIPAQ
jgi:hypothetical protein